jgi:uncharacterized protein YaaN involved in tellurite resistance
MALNMDVSDEAGIKKAVQEQVKPGPDEIARLQVLAKSNVADIMNLDIDEFAKRIEIHQKIESFGADTMKDSAAKIPLLQVTAAEMLSKDGDEGGLVAKCLVDLQREFKHLDPSRIDFARSGILGKLLKQIMDYYAKYQKADKVIANIIISLDRGEETLKNDNTTLEIEQQAMRISTKKLKKEIQLATLMDEEIEKQIEAARARNEEQEKIIFVTEEVLFPLRQRLMDMQTMIVVNQQGLMTTEIVIRTNKELIRGVERAKNMTIPAFRYSVMAAKALYDQKIVLEKLLIFKKTTENIIIGNAEMLKEQAPEIQKLAMQANISVEAMETAFANVMEALISISDFKQEALPKMRDTINKFKDMADKGEEQIQQMEKGHKLAL